MPEGIDGRDRSRAEQRGVMASSVFVKRPERIMALAFVMTLCLPVYKLAEVRLRRRLAQTGQTVPDQVRKPTARPTLRWLSVRAPRGTLRTDTSGCPCSRYSRPSGAS